MHVSICTSECFFEDFCEEHEAYVRVNKVKLLLLPNLITRIEVESNGRMIGV